MKKKYWIEILLHQAYDNSVHYYWIVKAINGRQKCEGNFYKRKVDCVNDAKSFALYTNMEIRDKTQQRRIL
jgi:hypothetical protein